jgi:transposase
MGQRTLVPEFQMLKSVLHELKPSGRDRLVMLLRSAGARSRCPVCGRQSGRVHSRYSRHLSGLPWEGVPVRIEGQVAKVNCSPAPA